MITIPTNALPDALFKNRTNAEFGVFGWLSSFFFENLLEISTHTLRYRNKL